MAGSDGRRQYLNGLLGQPLSLSDALRRSEGAGGTNVVLALFAVELGPLGIVAGLQKRLARLCGHRHGW
jgi:hypothetical protein